ncbi:hypothetical protein IW261DRAFT_1420657 [Armillaria novae-zelandiae]|uniref:Uncharacterized protein n=1 Tax=Armillaria novae-zelandiae TaxID=153914 RepID=A0AA39TBD2_9AGAR|nr:hypothetical protein IW261DRAFT_1420657 [Armillaria novae-zelandiae]
MFNYKQRESILLTTDYNLFMGIFKGIKRAIASWLLEWNSDSKEEKQSAVPSTVDTLPSAVPNINRIVPIYSRENGDIVGYVTHGDGTPGSIPSAQATHSETNLYAPVPLVQPRSRGPVRFFQDPTTGVSVSDKSKTLPLAFLPSMPAILHPSLEPAKPIVPHDFTRWPDNDLSDPAPLTAYIPLEKQPKQEACRGNDDDIEPVNRFICQKAWERLVDYTGCTTDGNPKPDAVDVDMEALILLEMRMFDRSEDAGVAGNHQWGLDVGMHQDSWYPWRNDGPEGEKNSCEGNESELEVGPDFDQEELVKWRRDQLDKQEVERKAQKVTYPKPKMLSRDTAVTMHKRRAPDEIPDKQSVSKSGNIEKDTAPPAKRSRRKSKHDTDPNR